MKSKHKKEFIVIVILSLLVIFEAALLIKFWPRKPKVAVRPQAPIVGKIAIIIDDWGYSLHNLNLIREISIPLDISILPHLPYSKEVAKEAYLNKKEILLHLPLEPHPNDNIRLENKVILTTMPKYEVIQIFNQALKSVPYCKGVNNHMGSLATEQKDLMSVIFREMKKKKLFFVDSMVTPNTICSELAEEIGIRFAERSIFLDNKNDAEYIQGQIFSLVRKAKKQGSAIGIGHDRPLTLKVIKEQIPEIEKQGIKFVLVSELVK